MNPEVLTAKKWYRWLWLSPILTVPSAVYIYFNDPGYKLICPTRWNCNWDLAILVNDLGPLLGSALWHLVLLIPALSGRSEFVRWHGRQALLLAAIRTATPLAFLIQDHSAIWNDADTPLQVVLILITIWFFGTLWGQSQAKRGECSLMRWTGHGAGLPLPVETAKSTTKAELERRDPQEVYDLGKSLVKQGKYEEAAQLFQTLLASDAADELRAMVAEELMRFDRSGTSVDVASDILVAVFRFSHDPQQKNKALAELKSMGLVEAL